MPVKDNQASHGSPSVRSDRRVDCDGASHTQRPRDERALGGSVDAGGANPPIGTARIRLGASNAGFAAKHPASDLRVQHGLEVADYRPLETRLRRPIRRAARRWQSSSGSAASRL